MEKVVVSTSADKVFEFLIDFARYPEWFDMVGKLLYIEQTSRGPIKEGSTFQIITAITNLGPFLWISQMERRRTAQFTKLVQCERLEVCFDDNLLVNFKLRSTKGGTELTIDTQSKSVEPISKWIMFGPIYLILFPILWLTGRLTTPKRMNHLRKIIETNP